MSARRSPLASPIDDGVASQSLRSSQRRQGRSKTLLRTQENILPSPDRVQHLSSPPVVESVQSGSADPQQSRTQQKRRSEILSKSTGIDFNTMSPSTSTGRGKKRPLDKALDNETLSASPDNPIPQDADQQTPFSLTRIKRPAESQTQGNSHKKSRLRASKSSSVPPPSEPILSPVRSTFFEKLQERAWSDPTLRHKLGKVVQRAERRAISVGNECLAQAIRKTFNDASGDTALLAALGAIINRRASNGQIETFQLHIRDSKASLRNQAKDREATRLRGIKEAAAIIQSRKSEQNGLPHMASSGDKIEGSQEPARGQKESGTPGAMAVHDENASQIAKPSIRDPQHEPERRISTPTVATLQTRNKGQGPTKMASLQQGQITQDVESSSLRKTRRNSLVKQIEADANPVFTSPPRQSGRARATRIAQPTLRDKADRNGTAVTPQRTNRQQSISSVSSLSSVGSFKQGPLELAAIERDDLPVPPSAMNGATALGNINQEAYPNSYRATFKQNKGKANKVNAKRLAEEDENSPEHEAKRQKLLRNTFEGYHVRESDVRPSSTPRFDQPPQASNAQTQLSAIDESNPGGFDERDDSSLSAVSSISGDLLVPPPPGALRSSKMITNEQSGQSARGPRGGRPGKTARMKVSPKKKILGPIAGLGARVVPKDDSFVSKTGSFENVDNCETCGGGGSLLCCDGCPRAFHVKCLDPPIDDAPEGLWYCQICRNQRSEPYGIPTGDKILSSTNCDVTTSNPRAFYLPYNMRDFFDSVTTGDEGQYEELHALGRARARPFAGVVDDKDDAQHPRTTKTGGIILCHRCGKSSSKTRDLVVCDFNEADAWHLDCLDPPLANPPVKWASDGTRLRWKCPLHNTLDAKFSTRGARQRKARQAKRIRNVRPAFGRGLLATGQIEIQNEESDIEMDGQSADDYGLVYHLHEKNIRLDFFDRIRKEYEAELHNKRLSDSSSELLELRRQIRLAEKQKALLEFHSHTKKERAAALALAEFAGAHQNHNLSENQVEEAVIRLLADGKRKKLADKDFKDEVEEPGDPSRYPAPAHNADVTDSGHGILDRETLLYLDSLIKARLAAL